jgi:hypothetical protein
MNKTQNRTRDIPEGIVKEGYKVVDVSIDKTGITMITVESMDPLKSPFPGKKVILVEDGKIIGEQG